MAEETPDTVQPSTIDLLYIQLELRKILQAHHRFPTTFIFPAGGYAFYGISGVEAVRFRLAKSTMAGTWKLQLHGTGEFKDTGCRSVAEVLLKYFTQQ